MKFGRLTAIKRLEQKAMEKVQNQYGFADVIVETKKEILRNSLVSGTTKSCGCLEKKKLKQQCI